MKYLPNTLGRLASAGISNTSNNGWDVLTTYTYDNMSRLATMTRGGKSVAYTRLSESDRLSSVSFGASYPQVNYSYDSQLRMTSKGLWTRTFNTKDEVTQIAPASGSAVGNLNWYHRYDSTGQLSMATLGVMGPDGPAGTAYNYSYDQIGNHLHDGITYNAVNQPSNLTYDANGNMTGDGTHTYTYDAENRLKRVLGGSTHYEFMYDYAGRCYQRNQLVVDAGGEVSGSIPDEYYIYDGTKKVVVVKSGYLEKYVWQPESSGDADVILWDQGGVYSTDCNKNVVAYNIIPEWPEQPSATYYDYTPFGVPVGNAGSAKRFMFSSEEWFGAHSTLNYGLYLYLYRAYSPALSRFLTRDPIAEQGGVNLYNFVANNPVTQWDALGFQYATYSIPRVTGDFNADLTGYYASKYVPDDKVDTQKGCCGLDITEKMNSLLTSVYRTLVGSSDNSWMLDRFDPIKGWDIPQLAAEGSNGQHFSKNSNNNCQNTVTYNGRCYRATAVNYALWGMLSQIHAFKRGHIVALASDKALRIYLASKLFTGWDVSNEGTNPISLNIGKSLFNVSGKLYAYMLLCGMNKPMLIGMEMWTVDCQPSTEPYTEALSATIQNKPIAKV